MQISSVSLSYPYINYSNLNFEGSSKKPITDKKYEKAVKYFNKKEKKDKSNVTHQLVYYNLKKLDGIQKGIEVFDGLSMKDINFLTDGTYILLNRGCKNNCTHCAYSAGSFNKKDGNLNKMSFEDYQSLIQGANELEKRLNGKAHVFDDLTLFLDSDCIDIEIEDKNGKKYDIIDCIKEAGREKVGMSRAVLLDTSGWPVNDKKSQQRAEKIVSYLLEDDGSKKVRQFNISINPYHGIYAKAKELENEGKQPKADKLKELYAKRMANVLFTVTPALETKNKINIIQRYVSGIYTERNDLNELYEIQDKVKNELEKMYDEDLNSSQKIVKTEADKQKYMAKWSGKLNISDKDNEISPFGRAEKLFDKRHSTSKTRKLKAVFHAKLHNYSYFYKAINTNGKVYMLEKDIAIPTNISLNFENKDKKTRPVSIETKHYKFNYKG